MGDAGPDGCRDGDLDDSHRRGEHLRSGGHRVRRQPGTTGQKRHRRYSINPDLSGKLVELLREIVPAMEHVGVLVNPANPGSAVQMPGVEDAARAMGLQLKIVEARTPEEFARGFARLSEHGAQGVVLLADPSSSSIGH